MGYRSRLFKTHNIVILRPKPSYYENFRFVDAGPPEEFPIKCNIQPFKENQKRFVLPEGMRVEHCIIVYSQDIEFKTSSVWGKTKADYFEYKGYEWECYQDQDWNGYGLSVDHSVCMAVRKDVKRAAKEDQND